MSQGSENDFALILAQLEIGTVSGTDGNGIDD